tara:strand:+ start:265 stop:717 length:453 start_codon:yes stop_codon:yes gene_type:complete
MTTFKLDATVETVETTPHNIWPGKILEAIWETSTRDQLTVLCEKDDGRTTTLQTSEGTIHWDDFFKQYSRESVDKTTDAHHKRKLELQEKDKKHKEKLDLMKDLFTAKLQAFEIPEVKDCDDKVLRSRIRKAKNPIEVTALVAVIIGRSL